MRDLIPLTTRVLGKDCSKLFWRYAQTYVPQGIKKHWEDANAFASFLQYTAQKEEIQPRWIVDLVRYETAWLQATNTRFHICWFDYRIELLVRSLERHYPTPMAIYQPTVAIWFRLPQGQLRHLVLPLFTSFNAPN